MYDGFIQFDETSHWKQKRMTLSFKVLKIGAVRNLKINSENPWYTNAVQTQLWTILLHLLTGEATDQVLVVKTNCKIDFPNERCHRLTHHQFFQGCMSIA